MALYDSCLLRMPEVIALVRLSRSSIYAMVCQGIFPVPVRIGRRAVAWRLRDIQEWLESRPLTRPQTQEEEVQ